MFQSYRIVSWALVLGLAAVLSGCTSQAPQEKQKSATPVEKSAQEKPAAQDEHADHAGVPEGLAELSADDRAAAEKQHVCPVSGDVLGAMGKPYKATVKGQTVFLCCSACEKDLMKDPDKYLAKMQAHKHE